MKNQKIALGTYGFKDPSKFNDAIKAAYELGYDFLDTAKIYANEKHIGRALEETNLKNKFKIQTKIWTHDFENVRSVFKEQLKDLRVDKVWSLLLHRPSIDFNLTINAWKALIELKKEGLVEHIGVSNFDRDHLFLLKKYTNVLPEVNQIELSVENFRADRVAISRHLGIKIQSWSPLGSTFLNNKVVAQIAKKYNVSNGSIMIAFLANQDLCPIVKSESPHHIKDNFEAIKIKLTSSEMELLHKENIFSPKYSEIFAEIENYNL